jgi:hypothetical protein
MLLGAVVGSLILRADATIFRTAASGAPQAPPAESPFGNFPLQQILCTTSFTQPLYPMNSVPLGQEQLGGSPTSPGNLHFSFSAGVVLGVSGAAPT